MGLADSEMQILYSVHMAEGKLYPSEIARLCGMSRQTQLLALNIYDTMYGTTGWQGVGQAKAVIFFILVAVIALIQNKLTTSKALS